MPEKRKNTARKIRRQPGANAPSWLLALLEIPRAMSEASTLIPTSSMLKGLPRGDGHAVMTLPGFLASGRSMQVVRNFLAAWGYDPHCWELGRNLGPHPERDVEAELDERLEQVYEHSGDKVSLVGWSLGGLFAREVARRNPDRVRSVITLGSPIGCPKATNAWRLYETVSGVSVDDKKIRKRVKKLRKPIDGVSMTAIYSETDAIVAAEIAQLPPGPKVENIGVKASHMGMGFNPAILYVIADRLRQKPHRWRRFDISGLRKVFYH